MKSKDARAFYSAFMEGELSAHEEELLRAHFAEHPKDAEDYRAFESVVAMTRSIPKEEAPSDFTAALMSRIRSAGSTRALEPIPTVERSFLERWSWSQVAAAAAMLVLGFTGGMWLTGSMADRLEADATPVEAPAPLIAEEGVPADFWESFEVPVDRPLSAPGHLTSGSESPTIVF